MLTITTIVDIAEPEGKDITQVRRVIRLTLLAPNVVARLLDSPDEVLESVMRRSWAISWFEQSNVHLNSTGGIRRPERSFNFRSQSGLETSHSVLSAWRITIGLSGSNAEVEMVTGFTFTKVVIVQSLESHEIETGRIHSDYIDAQMREHNSIVPVELIICSSSIEFLQILERLIKDARLHDEIPLLHVECHGSPTEGLEFENGSTLTWPEVAAVLLRLNIVTGFNLLTVFSACFGAYFLGQMGAINPAPCWCVVAPTESVDPGEILQGFRVFYSTFFHHADAGEAVSALARIHLSNGRWFGQFAELWFEKLVISYIEVHCTKDAVRKRATQLYRQLLQEGHRKSIGHLTRVLRQRNRSSLLQDYFDRYFITDQLPGNCQRFAGARTRLHAKISELRSSGKFVL